MIAGTVERRVTVVTLTHDRLDPLRAAIASVQGQLGVETEHLVIGDACPCLASAELRAALEAEHPGVTVCNMPRSGHEDEYLSARLARLRNIGTQRASSPFVAQLDDDNSFEPDHLATLLDALAETPSAEAAHSWRLLIDHEGQPVPLRDRDPWVLDPTQARRSFVRMSELGVFEPGSPIVRDALEIDGRLISRVDTSELLARRSLLERIPWPEEYSPARQRLGFSEDFALSHRLLRERVEVVCSRLPTLRYRMGGYSNSAPSTDDLRAASAEQAPHAIPSAPEPGDDPERNDDD